MRALVWRASLTAIITLSLAACGQAATSTHGGTAGTSSRPTSGASATPGGTTPAAPSAAADLAPFIAAAGQADSRLHHAAALVNGDIGAASMRFTPATVAAIHALGNAAVAHAIPAGLSADLLREVLAVYGDLSSRTAAFGGVLRYGYSGRELPTGGQDAKNVLRGLHNGAPAAARFDADLAAVRSGAQQAPPLALVGPDTRAAAELALRLHSTDKRNFCSEEFGGFAPAQLETVIWYPADDRHTHHYEGTISGISFQADYTAAPGWEINILAC
jgi:hypothetical protein